MSLYPLGLQTVPTPIAQHPDGGVVCPECGGQLLATKETKPTWECQGCEARYRFRDPTMPEHRLNFIRAIDVCCHHCEKSFKREVTHAKQWVECPHCGLWAIASATWVWTPEGGKRDWKAEGWLDAGDHWLKPCGVCRRDPAFGAIHAGCERCERVKKVEGDSL